MHAYPGWLVLGHPSWVVKQDVIGVVVPEIQHHTPAVPLELLWWYGAARSEEHNASGELHLCIPNPLSVTAHCRQF